MKSFVVETFGQTMGVTIVFSVATIILFLLGQLWAIIGMFTFVLAIYSAIGVMLMLLGLPKPKEKK